MNRPMSIRNRIFFSYVLLLAIIGLFVSMSGVIRAIRFTVEEDRAAVLELQSNWAATRMLLGDMIINWSNGAAYEEFIEYRRRFNDQLASLEAGMANRLYYGERFVPLFAGLDAVWTTADSHLERVTAVVEDPSFYLVEEMVQRQPGLQRLNHLWAELVDRNTVQSRRTAHLIQQLITEVEFFPIYGDTMERLMSELVGQAEEVQRLIARVESVGRLVFFLTFLAASLFLASRFSHSLSRPIISVTRRVREFAGLTGESLPPQTTYHGTGRWAGGQDEVALLSDTIDRMVDHYTDLAERAEQLARGEVTGNSPQFPREGVVGRSLDEIAEYLHELASTSAWIRNGEYGLRIRQRSENDVITRNFNIMSAVIHEKITTLRNMFEAVDEAVIVVDADGSVLEVNSQVYHLLGRGTRDDETDEYIRREIAPLLLKSPREEREGTDGVPSYVSMYNIHGHEVPVRMLRRTLPGGSESREQCMFLITNESWRARAKRERERLRAQATMAELRALRAQIHPHFFFNTLNTIAYLIETDGERAVGTVQDLADLFRYTLAATKTDRVPLREELRHIRKYLDIELLRHGDTLTITYDVDEAIHSRAVPPMLLQPLVENSIRYGGDASGHIHLTIRGRAEGANTVLEIGDNGCREIEPESLFHAHGTGIRNVNQRFQTLFGTSIRIRRNSPEGLLITLPMPGGGQ